MKFSIFPFLILIFLFSCTNEKAQESKINPETVLFLTPEVMCGTVQFTDGCSPKLDTIIQFGLALIHHMTFEDAEYNFSQVIEMDPDCFWGHWGKAMTFIHPLWPDVPSEERMKSGVVLSQRALELAKNDKEKLYGEALAAYYENGAQKTERERLLAYQAAWSYAEEQLPEDIEVRLFHALSRLATVSPSDKTYKVQNEVGAIAEKVLEEIPDHPGGFHYAIHAYDYPPLASKALRVAKNYSKIAPEIPHALHMPTHIFTRLGYWQESIDFNKRSAAVAWKLPFKGQISLHYLHALDYLVYAYLQQSESDKAEAILKGLDTLKGPIQSHAGSAYALAAIPARVALENQNWAEAMNIGLMFPSEYPWEKFPQFEAIVHFANGIGAARSGNLETAQLSYERLDSLQNLMGDAPSKSYWADQVKIQKTAVKAWLTFAQGEKNKALAIMNEAAGFEDATEKSPITPGELLPVREMLGDMLLEMGQPEEAFKNYEQALQRNPNRFNTIYGAGKSAELAGKTKEAMDYFNKLIDLGGTSDPNRSQILHASKLVN